MNPTMQPLSRRLLLGGLAAAALFAPLAVRAYNRTISD